MGVFKTENKDVVLGLIANYGYTLSDVFNNKIILDTSKDGKYFIDTEKKNIVQPNDTCESLYNALNIVAVSDLSEIENL